MASIRDVAREAGVSPATVSRVLNEDQRFSVKKTTRDKVLAVVEKLHYDPRMNRTQFKGVSPRKKSIIVLCTLSNKDEVRDLYFASIDEGIHEEAEVAGIEIGQFVRFPNPDFSFKIIKQYDGVIIIGTFTRRIIGLVCQMNNNVVIVDEYRYIRHVDLVRNNFQQETGRVLDNLYNQGHRSITFIGGAVHPMDHDKQSTVDSPDMRTNAYENWMHIHNLRPRTLITDWTPDQGYQAMDELLNNDNIPTAVVMASDQLAVGAYRAIQLHHLVIPQDICVVSFNDSQVASFLVPSLSSVHAPSFEMGQAAIRLMTDRLSNNRRLPCQVILPSELVERESSKTE